MVFSIFNIFFNNNTFANSVGNLQASLINCDMSNNSSFSQDENDLFVCSSEIASLIESPELLFVEDSFIKPVTVPNIITTQAMGVLAGEENEKDYLYPKKEISEYTIESGDNLSSIAEKFNISLNTLLWANDLTSKSKIQPGNKLIILPVSGVMHYVKNKETLGGIAKTYKVDIDAIVDFNELENEDDIYIGDILIIPDGVRPVVNKQTQTFVASVPNTPIASGYFIVPVSSPYIRTQGLHWHNAIDFSHAGYACGKPVYAAAGGTIQKVIYGKTGYGNYVTILHPNGVVTVYAHLSGINVKMGSSVSVGETIGYIGNSGYTVGPTGCHLHFEVRGATNPF